LTERGQAQAQTLAERLRGEALTTIYCSPLLRAEQTAAILAADLGLTYTVTDALCEYDCGVLEGRSDAEAWQQHSAAVELWLQGHDWAYKPEGGESFLDIQTRFVPLIEQLTRSTPAEPGGLVLVGHGGLYRLMLPLVLANISPDFAVAHGLDYTHAVIAETTGAALHCVDWCGLPLPPVAR
jgi:probable phosphoglycerate mutase